MSGPLQFLKCLYNLIYLKMSYEVAVYTISCTWNVFSMGPLLQDINVILPQAPVPL